MLVAFILSSIKNCLPTELLNALYACSVRSESRFELNFYGQEQRSRVQQMCM